MIGIDESAAVCETAILDNNNGQFRIDIGKGTVVHPRALIHAKFGDIRIGENCIVEEQVKIVNTDTEGRCMNIGSNNIFHVGALFEGFSMGSWNTLKENCIIHKGATIENECIIGMSCIVEEEAEIKDKCVIYLNDGGYQRTDVVKEPKDTEFYEKHIRYLHEILPKYNHIRTNR